MNLVLNAQAAMPEGGGITVRTLATPTAAWPEPGALVIVADDGFGMDPDTARRAFDPLFTTKISGTGLGLATAKMVTEAAGGSIDLESHAGIGTAVSIWLPAVVLEPPTTPSAEARTGPAQAEPTADGAAEPASSDAVTRSGTVLVVDDQPELLAVVRDLLADIGFQVVTATNGGDAVRAASSFDVAPDLLLTDLVMPELDGYEVADRLTAQFPGLAVVFMTAHADREVVGDQTERARYPILRKPFSRDELIDAVRAALG